MANMGKGWSKTANLLIFRMAYFEMVTADILTDGKRKIQLHFVMIQINLLIHTKYRNVRFQHLFPNELRDCEDACFATYVVPSCLLVDTEHLNIICPVNFLRC